MPDKVNREAATLMLTPRCSAGCEHCPFASQAMPPMDLSINDVENWLQQNHAVPLVVVFGGEPLEHPRFSEVLQVLLVSKVTFRIATGGHPLVEPWIGVLKSIPEFKGFSLGTDVLKKLHGAQEVESWFAKFSLALSGTSVVV